MAVCETTIQTNAPPALPGLQPWRRVDAPSGAAIAAEPAAEGLMPCHVSLPAGHREPFRPLEADETIWLVSGWLRLRVRETGGPPAGALLLRPGDRCNLPAGSERALEVLGEEPAYLVSGRRLGDRP